MVCRDCQCSAKEGERLCSQCGLLLGAEDIVRRVRKKLSQLARFGLAGSRQPLVKRQAGTR
jgi:predicted amidophosphoribosyltransferase